MNTHWIPHKKQEEALKRREFEILFGGARGGGKTDAGLVFLVGEKLQGGKWIWEHPDYRALVIRRNADDLSDWIDRAGKMYGLLGVSIAYRPAIIRFNSGAVIRTGHLKDAQAYTKYQGHEYHRLLIEELTQIPEEKRYLQLISSCRSTIPEIRPQVFSTTNPGNLGHAWVKDRFVTPSTPGKPFMDKTSKRKRIFIKSLIDDNPTLMKNDPEYVGFLDSLKDTDKELWKAWRMGDWETFAGQFFREISDLHFTPPFIPRDDMTKMSGSDWGYSPRPFVFVCAAMEKVTYIEPSTLEEKTFNRIWVYKEIAGTKKNPQEWARIIRESVDLDQFEWHRGDPSMNIKQSDGARSILDQFREEGITILPANNDRVNGWQAVRNWLTIAPDGLPYLIISDTCVGLKKNLPLLIYDEKNKNDLDTLGPDDEADGLRYMLIHTPWIDAKAGSVHRPKRKTNDIKKPIAYVSLDKWK